MILNNWIKGSTLLAFSFFMISSSFMVKEQEGEIVEACSNNIISFTSVVEYSSGKVFTSDSATTFILVRHAETTGIGTDPKLSSAGQDRAAHLNIVLSNVPLDAVYSTDLCRTRHTAQPTATNQAITIEIYNPFNLTPFVDDILANHNGGVVLIVGHSNTTPSLLNLLIGQNNYANIPESEYDNLYIVSTSGVGDSKVVHLKYGF